MIWLSVIIFILLRLPSLFEPYWYGDEGVYLVLGQAIRHGITLYSQIHDNKPPAIYYLAALTQTVFGFRLLLFLWMIPTCYFFYRLSLKFLSAFNSKVALLAFIIITSIPVVEGHIANAEIFMLLPTILGFLLFEKYVFLSGLCLGIAFLFKVPVAIEFFFLGCFLLIILKKFRDLKTIISFGLSFSIPIGISAIYFLAKEAIVPFLSASLFQNIGYLSSWSTGTQQSSPTASGLPLRLGLMLLSWILFYSQFVKKNIDRNLLFLSCWFTACLFGVLLSTRPYPHYLIQIIPPLILVLLSSNRFWINKVLLILALTFSIFHYKFYFYATSSYYQNFLQFVLRQKSIDDYRKYFGNNVNTFYQLSSYIDQQSSSDDFLFVWSDDPYLYPLANRLPSTRYVTAYHVLDFNGYDQTISQLKVNLPRIIVYNRSMNRHFPALDSLISRYYVLDNQIGNYYLFSLLL